MQEDQSVSENAAGSGNEIMTIERLLQTIYTPYRLPVPRAIMLLGTGRKALRRSDQKV